MEGVLQVVDVPRDQVAGRERRVGAAPPERDADVVGAGDEHPDLLDDELRGVAGVVGRVQVVREGRERGRVVERVHGDTSPRGVGARF